MHIFLYIVGALCWVAAAFCVFLSLGGASAALAAAGILVLAACLFLGLGGIIEELKRIAGPGESVAAIPVRSKSGAPTAASPAPARWPE